MGGSFTNSYAENYTETDGLNSQTGFTLIEIIALMIILSVLSAVFNPRILELHEDAQRVALLVAKEEFNTREHLAWAKYKLGCMSLPELKDPDTITGGDLNVNTCQVADSGGGDEKNIVGALCIVRIDPTSSEPGSWAFRKPKSN